MPNQDNQLKLSFGINAPESRAIFTGTALPDNSPVGVKLDGYVDYANLVYTGTTTSGTQSWALSEGSVTLTDTKGTIYAYWPYSSTTSIDAIDVDMTAADQTDWLYATPVTGICEDKAEAAVTMNHALANINITINKGSYLGTGAISNITVQSDGIALGGTFNAAQATPDYDAFENEGEPLSRDITTTTGAATDIMVVPTGTSAAITFLATIDGIQFTATSAAVTLEKGNSYVYTLNLSDINTYMSIGSFGVTPWNGITKETLPLDKYDPKAIKVYAVSSTGSLIDYNTADATAKGVALVAGEHKFMIAKNNAISPTDTQFQYDYDKGELSLTNYGTADGTNYKGFLPLPDGTFQNTPHLSDDFTTWSAGALSDFDGKGNTVVIAENSIHRDDMCNVLETFNAGTNSQSNEGFNDWYVPACGQLAIMYLAKENLDEALAKIGGTKLTSSIYWSSSETDAYYAWFVSFYNSCVGNDDKGANSFYVRFIRDLE